MRRQTTFNATLLVTAAAALMLSACGRNEDRTVGQQVDSAIASAEQKTAEAKTDIKRDMASAKEAAKDATADMKSGATSAATSVANKVEDASITAAVNAELAKDSSLSMLKINVDTVGGHVALHGTAPDAAARDRATRLASNVKGVTNVDNQLEVRS